jgi:hypothetical protein
MISRGKPLFLNLWVHVSLVHMSNVTYSKYTPTETWGNERYAVLAAVAAVGAVGRSTYRRKYKRRVKKSVLECVEQAGIKYATDLDTLTASQKLTVLEYVAALYNVRERVELKDSKSKIRELLKQCSVLQHRVNDIVVTPRLARYLDTLSSVIHKAWWQLW